MVMKIIKSLWIGSALFVLYVALEAFYSVRDNGILDVLTWLMSILTFPAGLVVSLVRSLFAAGFSITDNISYLSLTIEWATYFVFGYLQWFVLVPWLWQKWKAWRVL